LRRESTSSSGFATYIPRHAKCLLTSQSEIRNGGVFLDTAAEIAVHRRVGYGSAMRAAKLLLLMPALALLIPGGANATAGALDGNGCHYDRSNGNYHCHRDVAPNPDRTAPVKKSRENVCHDAHSPNYNSLKYFISFRTMTACVSSGGRETIATGGGLSGH
jgi:hypothetical protein